MDSFEIVSAFGQWYADEWRRENYDAHPYVVRDGRRVLRDMRKILDAVELFERYNIKL